MTPFNLLSRVILLSTTLTSSQLYAAASVLIWPIDPIISDSDKATALWLENKDSQPIYMQIRVLGWQQVNTQDDYTPQSRIIASPPVATIQPGKRQLIRLVKNAPVPAGQEQAYRILIDEIPYKDPNDKTAPAATQLGLKFQMRYSVPLFVYGSGVLAASDTTPAPSVMPTKLSYSVHSQGEKQWLNISNQGAVHARISRVTLQEKDINKGLLGYVLAGAKMSFPLSPTARTGELSAIINNSTKPIVIPHQ